VAARQAELTERQRKLVSGLQKEHTVQAQAMDQQALAASHVVRAQHTHVNPQLQHEWAIHYAFPQDMLAHQLDVVSLICVWSRALCLQIGSELERGSLRVVLWKIDVLVCRPRRSGRRLRQRPGWQLKKGSWKLRSRGLLKPRRRGGGVNRPAGRRSKRPRLWRTKRSVNYRSLPSADRHCSQPNAVFVPATELSNYVTNISFLLLEIANKCFRPLRQRRRGKSRRRRTQNGALKARLAQHPPPHRRGSWGLAVHLKPWHSMPCAKPPSSMPRQAAPIRPSQTL